MSSPTSPARAHRHRAAPWWNTSSRLKGKARGIDKITHPLLVSRSPTRPPTRPRHPNSRWGGDFRYLPTPASCGPCDLACENGARGRHQQKESGFSRTTQPQGVLVAQHAGLAKRGGRTEANRPSLSSTSLPISLGQRISPIITADSRPQIPVMADMISKSIRAPRGSTCVRCRKMKVRTSPWM